jgi:hypothetical protein
MATIVRYVAAVIGLFVVAAAVAADKPAAVVPSSAIDALLTRLDNIGHDPDMTTAKKAVVAADAIDKFNKQYKGKPLTVRLKVDDVVPYAQGHYLKASHPNLDGVQFAASKFQSTLSNAEVMSVTKESVLVVTGTVSASNQPPSRGRTDMLKPGGSIAFPLRGNPACRICLDSISYKLDVAPKIKPDSLPAAAATAGAASPASDSTSADLGIVTPGATRADKVKDEQSRSVDDIKAFFLKGIVQPQNQHGSKNAGAAKTGTEPTYSLNTRPGYGANARYGTGSGSNSGTGSTSGAASTKVKHNRIYTSAEIIQKFGNPTSRSSETTSEQWVYKCKDGVVHVHFTQVGYAGSTAGSKPDKVRLEIKSVESSSSPITGNSRF